MNVCFLKSSIAKRGGLEKYTLRLAKGFSDRGCKVTILTTDYEVGQLGDLPFTVVSLGKKSSFSLLQLIRFDRACTRYLKDNPQDIVFGMERNYAPQTHYRAGNGCHAAYLERRRAQESWLKCLSFRCNPLHRLILDMEKKTYESPYLQRLFVNSHMVEQELLAYYPKIAPEKITVVHNGVEWHELEKSFNESFPRLDGSYKFLFVGNEYARKGLYRLLQALTALPKSSFELLVVGKERNMRPFQERARQLGLEAQVTFVGAVSSVIPYYQAADALVIPSLYDPFANVTVEALAMGLQVISSDANGGSEVLTSQELGTVFSTDDELVHALKHALEHPKTRQSATTIRNMVQSLDFSSQITKIVDLTLL